MGIWDDIFGGGQPAIRGTEVDPRTVSEAMWAEMREMERTDPGLNPYYTKYKQYDPELRRQEQAAIDARRQAEVAAATTAAQASGTAPAPTVDPAVAEAEMRQDALARLNASLPGGFEQGLVPGTLDDPFVESALGERRGRAEEALGTLERRRTITPTGKTAGLRAIETQTPGIRGQLQSVADLLLEQERAGLRGIRGEAEQAASGLVAGQTFDPGVYLGRAQQRAGEFGAGFGTQFAGAAPAGDLYDLSGITGAASAVTGPRNISFDPYAVEGAKLSTGLGEAAPVTPGKKRTTEVF